MLNLIPLGLAKTISMEPVENNLLLIRHNQKMFLFMCPTSNDTEVVTLMQRKTSKGMDMN